MDGEFRQNPTPSIACIANAVECGNRHDLALMSLIQATVIILLCTVVCGNVANSPWILVPWDASHDETLKCMNF